MAVWGRMSGSVLLVDCRDLEDNVVLSPFWKRGSALISPKTAPWTYR